jgi:tetratricopeptide (TPR) repeat protein
METVPAAETAPAAPSSASDEDVSLPAPDKASVDEAAEEAAAPPADGVHPDTIRADEPAAEPVMDEDRPDGELEALDAQEANLAAREETLRTPEEDAAARARDVGEPPVPAVPSEPVGIDAPEPTLADAGSALLHQAQDHLEAHDLEAALDCYDAILETSPGDGEALFNKAEVLSMLGRIEEAIACFGQLLEGDPEHRVALAEMAHLLLEDGQLEEGLRTLRASIALDPGRAPEFLDRARRLRGDGKRDEAVLLYNAVLDAEEDNLDAAIGLGDTLLEMDDAAMASHVFTRAATRHPRNPVALHRKGLMLDREGRWGAAVQLFNRAIALEWNFVDAWVSKGDILRAHDRAHDALLCYAKALEFDGDRAEAWMGKALAHRALGEAEAAAEAARRAKALDPTLPDLAAFREALEAQVEGPPPKGVLDFFGTPQAEAEDAEVLCQLAELALEAGDAPMALIRFEEACAVDPRNAKAWTGKGIALQHMERYEKALACYDEALALDPQFELARRWRETCLKRMGGS